MIDLTKKDDVKALLANLHATFDTAQGKEVMKFMEQIGSWYPTVNDPMDTNSIIARDANRRLLGTIKTLLNCSAEQVITLATEGGEPHGG